jgi:hypothetical protein
VTNVQLGTPVVVDNCGSVTVTNDSPSAFGVGTNIVTWTATDAKGNSTNASQRVVVIDSQPPLITPPLALLLSPDPNTNVASNVNLGNPVASDNCGIASVTNNAPGVFPIGTNVVTWAATDVHGNVSTSTQQVVVNPVISGPHRITGLVPGVGGCTLSFTGMANGLYIIQASSNLLDWISIHTNAAGTNGTWVYVDSSSLSTRRFYRSVQP